MVVSHSVNVMRRLCLFTLSKNANGRNNNLQILSAMHATAEAIGRGGESASQTYREWEFDYLYNVVNTRWKEQKCPNAYAMPWVADIDWKAKKLKLKPSLR